MASCQITSTADPQKMTQKTVSSVHTIKGEWRGQKQEQPKPTFSLEKVKLKINRLAEV